MGARTMGVILTLTAGAVMLGVAISYWISFWRR
jgi:hypothetical protein